MSPARSCARDVPQPTWLEDEPHIADRAWPPGTPRLAADGFYARLVKRISVPEDTNRSVSEWLDQAAQRIVGLVRPHVLDVDAILCGSFAARTHIETEPWDVDIAIRLHAAPDAWEEPGRALDDIRRWLSHGIAAPLKPAESSITIKGTNAPSIDVVPCWRTPDGDAGLARVVEGRFDPAGHRDLLAARDASLGQDSVFLKLIRVVKHLNRRWSRDHGRLPVSSFHIEALALTHCTRSFTLAEEVAEFLTAAARGVRDPLPDPLGAGPPILAEDPDLAAGLFEQAALKTESALMTADPNAAEKLLADVFGEA